MQIFDITRVSQPTISQQTDKPLFKQGERLEASVVSTDGRSVSLKLGDGSTLVASRSANEVMRPGDSVTLEVDSSSASSAQLRLVEVNSQPVMPEISREQAALMRVSYQPTPTAAANMRTLESLSIPASTQTLSRMAKIQQSAPSLSAARAALLASTDIPVSINNIKAFSSWLDSPVSASVLANALNDFSIADPKAAKAVLEAFAANAGGAVADANGETANANGDTLTPVGRVPLNPPFSSAATPAEGAVGAGGANAGMPVANAAGANSTLPPSGGANGETLTPVGRVPLNPPPSDALTPTGAQTSPPFKRVLGELFLKLSQADEAATRGEAVKNAVTKLPESVARLSSALNDAASRSQAAQPSLQASASLASQLSMGAELGGMLYAQIPLRSESEHSTADLYIVKRDRGSKRIDEANATVALCIETQNLGRVESLIHIEKNDLTLRFRVETEREAKFIKSRLSELRALDFPAQYTLRGVSVALADEPLTLNNAARTLQREFALRNAAKGLDIQI